MPGWHEVAWTDWDYYGGVSGTIVTGTKLGAGERVMGIAVHATTAGTVAINGGDSVPVPANVQISIVPLAVLKNATIVCSGTDSFFVEVVN